jgi:SSS family solute:Na+ symporter
MLITFLAISFIMVLISILAPSRFEKGQPLQTSLADYRVSGGFLVGSILIFGILAALYTIFW